MRLQPSALIIGLLLSAGAAFIETVPAQASMPEMLGDSHMESPLETTAARSYRRRTRTSHRGSGRREMIRHILATEA